jgi:predicted RNA-binding Zn-ribbon protein involved in translation (DUF1610 family)
MSRARGKSTPKKIHIKLHVIPESAEEGARSVLIKTTPGLLIRAKDAPNVVMDCGACGERLIQGCRSNQVANMVLKCSGCGAFNETVEG